MKTDYEFVGKQIEALAHRNRVTFFSNISALLNENMDDINWVGFYMVEDDDLVLGPFQGKVACTDIKRGKGVCGTALEKDQTQLVENVHEFPGHIACDSASNSEIVVPIHHEGKVMAVLDIDSPSYSRFTAEDKEGLEMIVNQIEKLIRYE